MGGFYILSVGPMGRRTNGQSPQNKISNKVNVAYKQFRREEKEVHDDVVKYILKKFPFHSHVLIGTSSIDTIAHGHSHTEKGFKN